jgi:hypothetical protein
LRTLLTDLDRINWDDATMAHLVYEQLPIGSRRPPESRCT